MKSFLAFSSAIVFLCIAGLSFAADAPAASKTVEVKAADSKAAATINGIVITDKEVARELEFIRSRFEEKGRTITDEQLTEVRGDVIERLVRKELLAQASSKAGILVSKEEIEKNFQMVKAQYKDQGDFDQMMKSLDLNEDEIKVDIGRDMAIRKLIDTRFFNTTTVSEEEGLVYFEKMKDNFRRPEEVRASHILIKAATEASAEDKSKAKEKIVKIRERLVAGEDFATLARELSEGPSAVEGGDLGFFSRGQMVPSFEEVAFSLKPGELSEIVETPFGYHVIKVAEHTEPSTAVYADVSDRITDFLKQEKIQQSVAAYIEELKKQGTIVLP